MAGWTLIPIKSRVPLHSLHAILLSRSSTMAAKFQRPKGQNNGLSSLNEAIDVLDLAKEVSSITPAKTAFCSASVLLTEIRVGFLLVHVGRSLDNVYRTQWPTKWTMSN